MARAPIDVVITIDDLAKQHGEVFSHVFLILRDDDHARRLPQWKAAVIPKIVGLTKGLARHPVAIMLLARLAVAIAWQGNGLGSGLLKDTMLRTVQAADIAGIRAFAGHAKDDEARAFYERFDFVASASDAYHLFRLLEDIRAAWK
jgi:hypothetical protein